MQGFFWLRAARGQNNLAGNGGPGILGHNRLTRGKFPGTRTQDTALIGQSIVGKRRHPMKGIIAWALGVPIVVIILLYVTNVF